MKNNDCRILREESGIEPALANAFLDKNIDPERDFVPSLVTNDHRQGQKVLSTLERQMRECDAFEFSVAFITLGGITPLLETFRELERRNVPGRILTTDYLTFSEPKALEKLSQLKNIEVRMYGSEEEGFHTKGYIFHKDGEVRMVIGSSNMTMNALTRSEEWNAGLLSLQEGAFAEEVSERFEQVWNSRHSRPLEEILESYSKKYEMVQEQKRIAALNSPIHFEDYTLTPNPMQVDFTRELVRLEESGEDRALLVSATGTGKTYASAFGLRELAPKKALFLVHREQIARQAEKSYRRVLGPKHTYGFLSGTRHDTGREYTFATVQSASRDEFLNSVKPDEYDVVVIDEVHRAGAKSYQKIMNTLKPKFWLGMSASPERTDGFDIYQLFDHNIAGEIRLQQALEEDYLTPFHYFGLTDLSLSERPNLPDGQPEGRAFRFLEEERRIDHIMKEAEWYGHSGKRVKGLIFVSNNEEAKRLSDGFNKKGWRTLALSGADSQEKREEAIERLVSDEREDALDYLISVDVFNEGVDIPEINQVIMLRPTQSAIVFVQQLGRGLRKAKDKEFVAVLDFIGNYESNYLIPIALSGDRSYNKDVMRHFVSEGTRLIPGASTIHFDEIARNRIYQAVDQARTSSVSLLKDAYQQLKFKLGRIPKLEDFDRYESIDPNLFFQNKAVGSYPAFLQKYEPEYKESFDQIELDYLKYISGRFGAGKWIDELLIIEELMKNPDLTKEEWPKILKKNHVPVSEHTMPVLENALSGSYAVGTGAAAIQKIRFADQKTGKIEKSFEEMLDHPAFKNALEEIISFAKSRHERDYARSYKNTKFSLNARYTYDEVCRLLEWEKPAVAQNIGGYWIDKKTKSFPVFINYDKKEDVEEHLRYHDRFLSRSIIRTMSKNSRTHNSDDMQTALHAKENGVTMHLFVRKNKDDHTSKEFYYLGEMEATGFYEDQKNSNGKNICEMEYRLSDPVREDLYDYLTS